MGGKVSPPLLVNSLKINMPEKMSTARELGFTAGARPIGTSIGTMASTTHDLNSASMFLTPEQRRSLLTEAGLHRHSFTTFGPPARDHRPAALGLHTRAEAVRL
jgi:hypothetical protein